MSWGRYSTNGSSAMQPDFDDDDYGKIVELSGGQGGNDPDYSKPADYSEAQDYSGYDDPNQAAYHHGPKRGENFQTYYDRQQQTHDNLRNMGKSDSGSENLNSPYNPDGSKKDYNDRLRELQRLENGGQSPSGFNYTNSGNSRGSKNEKQGSFASRHKKGLIGLTAGLGVLGSVFGIGILVSGPMQFLQLDNLIRDKIGYLMENTVTKRVTRNLSSFDRFIRGTNEYSIRGTRMNVMADRVANSRLRQLGEKGINFSQNGRTMRIDVRSNPFIDIGSADIENPRMRDAAIFGIADNLGVDPDLIKIVDGSAEIDIGDMTSFSKRLKTLNKMNDVGKFNIISRIKTRILNRKLGGVGSVSWFHPIKKLQLKVSKDAGSATERFSRYLTKKLFGDSAEKARTAAIQKATKEALEQYGVDSLDEIADVADDAALAAIREGIEEAGQQAFDRITAEQGDGIVRYLTRRVLNRSATETAEVAAGDIAGKAAGATKIGFVSLFMDILDMLCMIEAIDDEMGMYQMMNVVTPVIADSQSLQSVSSQAMSGFKSYDAGEDPASDDCTDMTADEECVYIEPLEQMGLIAQQKLFNDNIRLVEVEGESEDVGNMSNTITQTTFDENGNQVVKIVSSATSEDAAGFETEDTGPAIKDTGFKENVTNQTISDSIWKSAPLKAINGDGFTEKDITDTVPLPLTTVGEKDWSGMANGAGNAWVVIRAVVEGLNTVFDNPVGDVLCGVLNSFIGGIVMNVLAGIIDIVIASVPGAFTGGAAAAGIMGGATALSIAMIPVTIWLTGMANGEPMKIDENTLPSHHGSNYVYGQIYKNNAECHNSGCDELEEHELYALWNEQERHLAEEWAEKPWYAKIFDPTDYRSAANQIARAANFDVSSQDPWTQLGNVGRFFGSLPKLFGVAINNLSGVARANDARPFGGYDFGVPIYGYSLSDQEKLTSEDYDIFANTKYIMDNGLLSANKSKLEKCFAVTVTNEETMELDAMDNSDGAAWNYIDNKDDSCNDNGEDWMRLRIYVMDYFNMAADDCYYGDESNDSCALVGY